MDFAKIIAKIDSIESKQSLNEGWEDMMKSVHDAAKEKEKEKGTGKFDKKETSTGTVYTRKSSTFDDGGDDSDTKKAKKKARSKADESVEELDETWGAGLDALEKVDVEQALSALQKYAPDAKVGPGFIKAGNAEVAVSPDHTVALADLNKAVRTLKGVQANPLRRVQEEDAEMEEGIEDRLKDLDPKNPVNVPAYQRKAASGDSAEAAKADMNRLRKLAGQPPKMESTETVEEDDVEEGNEFSGELAKAKAAGKEEFEVGGKKYKVKEEQELAESAAPGQEDWIKSNKDKFIKQYGKEKGEEVLYATAWKRSKAAKESQELQECYDQAMAQESGQESGMNISSNLDTKTGNKSLTITAQGQAAEQLAQLLKLSGMQAQAHEEPMEEEYANSPEPVIQGAEVQMQQGNDLNRPKQTYPKVAGGDNPMAMAEAAELAAIEKRLMEELDSIKVVSEKYMGFDKTVAAIKKGGSAKDPEAVAASIGRKKYGKEKFQKAAATGKKLGK